jgi:hypothetical protein
MIVNSVYGYISQPAASMCSFLEHTLPGVIVGALFLEINKGSTIIKDPRIKSVLCWRGGSCI